MLTISELVTKYPVRINRADRSWRQLIDRAVRHRKLIEGKHFDVRRECVGKAPMQYDEQALLRFLWDAEGSFAMTVRVEHGPAIKAAVKGEA